MNHSFNDESREDKGKQKESRKSHGDEDRDDGHKGMSQEWPGGTRGGGQEALEGVWGGSTRTVL